MKTNLPFGITYPTLAFLIVLVLITAGPRARAQGDVSVSAAEFHRIAYSGHVLSQMALKPELDAVCQTLLEVHRRNPQADPLALAGVLTNALERFRSNAPVYLRVNDSRDEILAVYLEAFHQVPAHTNFDPATMVLLNAMMGYPGQNPPTHALTAADLVNAGSQGFVDSEDRLTQRQTLVDACARRAEGNASFRQAVDAILVPESGLAFDNTAAQIINGNIALSNNPTMQTLLALSSTNGDGSLQVSRVLIDTLFANEMQRLRDTVAVVHQAHLNIMAAQSDFMAYLANTNLVETMAAYEEAQKDPHVNTVVAAPASVHALSELMKTHDVTVGKCFRAAGTGMASLALAKFQWNLNTKLAAMQPWKEALAFDKVAKGLSGFGMAATVAQMVIGFATPSPEQIMLEEIGKVKQMIFQLGTDMHDRFDQVDHSLNTIQTTLDDTMELVNVVEYDVQQIRQSLINVQLDLHRLERQLFSSFTAERRGELNLHINGALFYENKHLGSSMPWAIYTQYPDGPENFFHTYASDWANDDIPSPAGFAPSELADENLNSHFNTYPLNASLNYTKEALVNRGILSSSGLGVLANPQDWFVSAYAYLQLALENPQHFRRLGLGLNPIIAQGQQLTNFLSRLTFTGTNVNRPLHDALLSNYQTKLTSFLSQVHATEQNYAGLHQDDFPVDTWRNWAVDAPRIQTATATVTPAPLYAQRVAQVTAGYDHTLALKTDGTVVGWGNNSDSKATPPASLASVVAVAAGRDHSLALKADRTVTGWGNNTYLQRTPPAGLQKVVAVAAGDYHSLALKADGTVVGWGRNDWGQATGVRPMIPPYNSSGATVTLGGQPLTGVVAIAAGFWHSMALKANGTVVVWGNNYEGQTNAPVGLNNVTAIAANGFHCLALRNGSVIAWGDNDFEQIDVPPLVNVVGIAAGSQFSMALKSDGTIVGWGTNGFGQITCPTNATGFKTIAAGGDHSLALTPDGSVVAWGRNSSGQSTVPNGSPAGGAVAVAAGQDFSLALKTDGTVVGWGNNSYLQRTPPPGLQNVVAIAAGWDHSLALKADGTVVGWGRNNYGQATGASAGTNVVGIAAGSQFSLALKSDGTVVAWGNNSAGQVSPIPSGLGSVVTIAAGWAHSLALKADGTVVSWGNNHGPGLGNNVVGISAGRYHSLAFKKGGTVVAQGEYHCGYSSPPDSLPEYCPATGGYNGVVAVASGGDHFLALHRSGSIWTWGYNEFGSISPPASATNVVAISGGRYHGLALRADGTVVAWGNNNYGQTSVPTSLQSPESFAPLTKPLELAANAVATQFDGLLFNGPISVSGVGALSCYALSFYNVDDYLVVTNIGSAIPTNEITVEFWQRLATTTINQTSFYLSPNPTGNRFSFSDRADGSVIWDFGDINGNTGRLWSSPSLLVAGAWQHIALVAKAGPTTNYMAIYCNGVLKTNRSSADAFAPGAYDLYLGDITGDLDDFRIWNVARTQEEIAANMSKRLSGTEPNLVAYWTFDDKPFSATKVAAGIDFSVTLRPYGRVVAWGVNDRGQCNVPAGLAGVVDIAAGQYHSLALKADGSVVGWGWNTFGQASVPAGLANAVAIAAGGYHSLALGNDGFVRAWGCTNAGQTRVPGDLDNVVAIAAGGQHSLALKADATVVAWGANTAGQTNVPTGLDNVVAVAAGENHCLALRSTGDVIAWGWNGFGQTNVPAGATSNVVAIAALKNHSLALRADGTVVAWGENTYGQTNLPPGLGNVVSIAAGGRHNIFLTAPPATGGAELEFILADVPSRVPQQYLRAVYANSVEELAAAGPLYDTANDLSGAKALLQAVLELGMSRTLVQDDVLHGFFYGDKALTDREVTSGLFSTEANRLFSTPDARPMVLEKVVSPRFNCFATRLNQCLGNLAATGQPEIPRIVGHTLRLLNLLRDTWSELPPPAVEIGQETNSVQLVLYGEPFAHHALQECTDLSLLNWTTATATNWHNEEALLRSCVGSPARFYRAVLPPVP